MLEFSVVALAILWIVVLVQGSVIVEILRQIGRIKAELPQKGAAVIHEEGLPSGAQAPDLGRFPALAGTSALDSDRRDYMLLVMSPECATCRQLAQDIGSLDLDISAPVVHVVRGNPKSVDAFIREFRLPHRTTIADVDGTASDAFKIQTTPSAVVVGKGRVLGHGVVNTAREAAAFFELMQQKAAEVVR